MAHLHANATGPVWAMHGMHGAVHRAMKILDSEEREAHRTHIAIEGVRGGLYGLAVSVVGFWAVKRATPQRFATFNHSIKSCMIVMPSIAIAAYWADQGSVAFDRQMYLSAELRERTLARYRQWKQAGLVERIGAVMRG